MAERFFRLKECRRKKEIRILLEKGLNLFINLPMSDEEYPGGPSSREIVARKIKSLPRADREFLLDSRENKDSKAKIWADFVEQDYWVGIEVPGFRVRYLGKDPMLQVLYEKKVGDSWEVISSEEREEWEGFRRVVRIGEALLDS